ncbi:MAG: alpha/beta fold hydrolase [Planctomycetota bacterium]|jgi:pimeloyl-ACP methyl ester carboxylesterase
MDTKSNPRCSSLLGSLFLSLLLPACGGLYQQLRPESEISDLADLSQSCTEMPGKLSLIQVGMAEGKPFRIAIEEKGSGQRERMIIMIHGVLADRSVWKYVAGDLGQDHDLLLVDLPGCGDSDKPNPAFVGETFYSPDSMARAVLEALRLKLVERPYPEHLTIMAHSLGGMVTLRMMGNPELVAEYGDIIDRVDDLVLLSPLDIAVERMYPDFEKLAKMSTLKMEVGELLGLVARHVGNITYEFSEHPERMPREEADRLSRILSSNQRRRAAQAMLRQAIPFGRDERPDWQLIAQIESWYESIEQPCLIIWGAQDESLPASMGYKLAMQLPDARLRIIEERSHALPCEAPVLCSELTRRFTRSPNHTEEAKYARLSSLPSQKKSLARALLDEQEGRPGRKASGDLPSHPEPVQPELPDLGTDSQSNPR